MILKYMMTILIILKNIIEIRSVRCLDTESMVKCITKHEYQFCIYGQTYGKVYSCGFDRVCNARRFPYCLTENTYSEKMVHQHVVHSESDDRPKRTVNEIEYCLDESHYALINHTCNPIHNKYTLIPSSGCKLYSICHDTNSVILARCPDGLFFDGVRCSKSYKCLFPCKPIARNNNKIVIGYAILSTLHSGFKRWPVFNSSCRNFIELYINADLNTVTVLKECPPNTWFDPDLKYCRISYYCQDNPHTVRKCKGKEKQIICDPEFNVSPCKPGYNGIKSIPGTGCHYYVICDMYIPKVRKCPDGELFNDLIKKCVNNNTFTCPYPCQLYENTVQQKPLEKNPRCTLFQGGKYTGPLKNSYCSKYVDCSTGEEPIIKTCPANSFYNPLVGKCMYDYKCPEYNCVPLALI